MSEQKNENVLNEDILDEIIDLEDYARQGKRPPLCKGYRIKINGEQYVVEKSSITGAEVLTLAGLVPPETYTLRVKKAGQRPEKIELNDVVDLRSPGIEKFKALPRDQTEGRALRHQFQLPKSDVRFLKDYGLPWETVVDGSQWLMIYELLVPKGYNQPKVTAAIRIETGYPAAPLDMVYFNPALTRVDGHVIGATQYQQLIEGHNFQRWSRHRTIENPWISGKDSLGDHIILIEEWLSREFEK